MSKHKRAASGSDMTTTVAKRPKKQQATPTKSQYFAEAENDDADPEVEDELESPSADESASEFADGTEAGSPEPEDDEDEDDESDDATPRGKGSSKATRVWKPGTKSGLGPGQQLVIKKPKARPAGKTPYTDATIHPNTMLFLGDLKANNERSWLKSKSEFLYPYVNSSQRDLASLQHDEELEVEEKGQTWADHVSQNTGPFRGPSNSQVLKRGLLKATSL